MSFKAEVFTITKNIYNELKNFNNDKHVQINYTIFSYHYFVSTPRFLGNHSETN